MKRAQTSFQRFEDDGETLIVTAKHVETIYKRRNSGLKEQFAKDTAKEIRTEYKTKTRAIKQGSGWSVFVEEQSWVD